ncbi:hypothetical protein [Bradyrhizobium sp. STM 3566]|uniref:hypothetical protein n=1 Tax=Bradyrhizobium sp. STM 3566 TaxID=578928 RepID=UPI00388F380A
MQKRDTEIDPEFLDVIIQSLSALSSVATIASTWLMLRQQREGIPPAGEPTLDHVRQQLRTLRRNLEDTFEAAESVLRVLEQAHARSGAHLLDQQPRFGAGIALTTEEMHRLNNFLNSMETAALHARNAARNIINMAAAQHIADIQHFTFDPAEFNKQLNSILFDSRTLGEAVTKLRLAQQQAEDFVSDFERALRRN